MLYLVEIVVEDCGFSWAVRGKAWALDMTHSSWSKECFAQTFFRSSEEFHSPSYFLNFMTPIMCSCSTW